MAPRLPFTGRKQNTENGQALPPYAEDPSRRNPVEQLVGHTPPEQDAGEVQPRVGAPPIGASGRANFYGLPQYDEVNPKLTGPQGLRMLDEMYWTDAHVRRLVLAAWSPIVAGTWRLEPYGGEMAKDADVKIADTIWWALNEFMTPNFQGHLYELGPALLRFGFVPFEQQWDTTKHDGQTLLLPRHLGFMLPRTIWRWWQDDYGELTHIGQILPNKADVIIPRSELSYYRLAQEGDNWMGRSLLRHAYKHWVLKDRLERIDAIGMERKAVGVPVVYHSPDIPTHILDSVETAIANMHVSEVAYILVPGWKMGDAPADASPANQWLIDIVQFDSSSGDSIKDSIQYHQTSMSSSFLTDFLELGHHQVGARATAEVQVDPFLTAIEGGLLPPVLPELNRLVDRIRKLNWGDAEGSPKLELTMHDDASLSEISAYVQQCVAAGAMVPDPDLEDWLRDRGSLPPANADFRAAQQQVDQAQQDAELAQAQSTKDDPQGLKTIEAQAKAKVAAGGPVGSGGKPPAASANTRSTAKNTSSSGGGKKKLDQASPSAAGLIVQAADTGRVLMIQRTDDHADSDDTRARWEFAGGKLDDGETPWDGGLREWQEETGATLPADAKRTGEFVSPDGVYQGFGVRIPSEKALKLGQHDESEVADVRWWTPAQLASDHRIRGKVQEALPDIQEVIKLDDSRRVLADKHPDPASNRENRPQVPPAGLTLDQPPADQPGQLRADIAIDFDGVLHPNTPDWHPLLEPPMEGAVDGMRRLARKYTLIVYTARTELAPVRAWLTEHGFGDVQVTNRKPVAEWYIDDRAFPTGFVGWPEVERRLLDAPSPPPNLRDADNPLESCSTCKMFYRGECGGYWNLPVDGGQTCDSWTPSVE